MLEDDRIVCHRCEKVIRYERPLFCPYCGEKLEPVEGFVEGDSPLGFNPWAGVAPFLVKTLGIALGLLLPVAWILGRPGVIGLIVLFCCVVTIVLLLSVFVNLKKP